MRQSELGEEHTPDFGRLQTAETHAPPQTEKYQFRPRHGFHVLVDASGTFRCF